MNTFPLRVSLTVTNACNLRCRMCGQWSEEGYIYNNASRIKSEMSVDHWKKVIDEIDSNNLKTIFIRGGEPFLYPGIMELLKYINDKGIFMSIDTNGTQLEKYAGEIVQMGNMHLTISVDGPEEVHDRVRGIKGTFQKLKNNIAYLNELDNNSVKMVSKSICFTISKYNFHSLGQMPDVARSLGISSINIVPYYYFPHETGKKYENELKNGLGCKAFSWQGFHHEDSGVDSEVFIEQLRNYKKSLSGIEDYPYMPLTEEQYKTWFSDTTTHVTYEHCVNVENLIDIQPNGDVNFCVDFPDYVIGNVKQSSIGEIWNSEQANRFREYRRKKALAVCYRCGAKFMGEIHN